MILLLISVGVECFIFRVIDVEQVELVEIKEYS